MWSRRFARRIVRWPGAPCTAGPVALNHAGIIKGFTMPKMTFIERDGQKREVEAPIGLSVLEVAHKYGVDIEGACEGSLACSTCHVIAWADWYGKLKPAAEEEEDMLDVAFGLQKTPRLGCQIVMTEALDGLV